MRIWILNHYATIMFSDKAGRHYWFARELNKRGHNTSVFAAASYYDNNVIDLDKKKYAVKVIEKISFVFVKTKTSVGNGFGRIKSWIDFYRNLFPATKEFAKENGKPDVIIASSVHPLTMVAGIKIAKKMRVPCICEIRDLWPEAIFQFGKAKEKSIIGRILIKGEHWIYKRAKALIFTKEGDTDYLRERGWIKEQGGDIDLTKCYYINNGVDIEDFENRVKIEVLDDADVKDGSKFNVTYTGTIRPINNVGNILDTAKLIMNNPRYKDIQFLIFGSGDQLKELKERVNKENIINVKLKGAIERKYIPYVLSKSSLNMLNYAQGQYNWTRGNSSNKLFEYMASGKPIISTVHMGYSLIKRYECGVELDEDTPEALAKQIMKYHDMNQSERNLVGENAKRAAKDFDFSALTDKLEKVIESVI